MSSKITIPIVILLSLYHSWNCTITNQESTTMEVEDTVNKELETWIEEITPEIQEKWMKSEKKI